MISYAQVKIKDGQVYSLQYDDIYYNTDDGPAESEYVFLKGNDLPAQWQEKPRFAIAETGFGTGLNFLVTLKTWLDDSARCETLDYYAIEAYPLRSTQLAEIHALWPQFKLLSTKLIEQYPSHASGCHSLSFGLGRVQLHLIFEDIKSCLRRYRLDPDCWFLDGFAPARNPSMWTAEVLNSIALQSRHGTTLSTFTAGLFRFDNRKQCCHCTFHYPGAFHYLGKEHFTVSEEVTHHIHSVHQRAFNYL
jgi:tRNA 5-methylaminomethyl-2-thiouridine biosynthesis bifunctional protein